MGAKLLGDQVEEIGSRPAKSESPMTVPVDVCAFVVYIKRDSRFLEAMGKSASSRSWKVSLELLLLGSSRTCSDDDDFHRVVYSSHRGR